MKKRLREKIIASSVLLVLAVLFVIKFGAPSILTLYVESGMGGCQQQPVFCTIPNDTIIDPSIDQDYVKELIPYNVEGIRISIPKGFSFIKQNVMKVYYKRKKVPIEQQSVIYILARDKDFFVSLFPQFKKNGIANDYDFLWRTMNAKTREIKNLNDAFFSIMKSIFTPNLGDQKNLKILNFTSNGKRGFISYSSDSWGSYFDCNLLDARDNFFKLYIRDKRSVLDVNKILAILSTLNRQENTLN